METVFIYILFAVGLFLIVKGGDWFVDGASWLAEVTGIPRFIVGATVVSLATTLPEIFISAVAAVEGQQILMSGVEGYLAASQEKVGVAIGNGVGSIICNTGLIMAIGIMFIPTKVDRRRFSRKAFLLGVSLVALIILTRFGNFTTQGAIILLVIFAAYIVESVKSSKSDFLDDEHVFDTEDSLPRDKKSFIRNILLISAGAVSMFLGSRLLVDNGGTIARSLGVSETTIAVTVFAIGTSLPELTTAIVSVIKKQPAMSVGNIVGANAINSVLILPICSFIYGGTLPVSQQNIYLDFPVMILLSIIALVPTVLAKRFHRWQGVLLLVIYIAYIVIVTARLDWYLALFQ